MAAAPKISTIGRTVLTAKGYWRKGIATCYQDSSYTKSTKKTRYAYKYLHEITDPTDVRDTIVERLNAAGFVNCNVLVYEDVVYIYRSVPAKIEVLQD